MAKKQNKQSIRRHVNRHVKLAVVPHAANQYRPHLIRYYGIIATLVVVVILQFIAGSSIPQAILGDEATVTPNALLAQTNTERQAAHKPLLQLNDQLSQAAYLKAQDMYKHQYWAHVSPSGVQPWQWLGDVSYNYSYAGENLAKNFHSPSDVMTAWMASETHRDNILKAEYQDVGFAIVDGTLDNKPASLIVALYGTPAISDVQGAQFASAQEEPLGIVGRFGRNLQMAPPVMVGSAALLLFVAIVALVAHQYRNKLPKPLRQSWYRHHGAMKAAGLGVFLIVVVFVSGMGGQI